MDYDLITVGGGLAGATLARTLAERGMRVLVVEREDSFRDRVRGEGLLPWGVNEARKLGIYDLLVAECATPIKYWTSHTWNNRPPRNLLETTPGGAPCLTFYHPAMQEVMLAAATAAGAEVRRGAGIRKVDAGPAPSVTIQGKGEPEILTARMVVGADGRESVVRKQCRFEQWVDTERLIVAGMLLADTAVPGDSVHVFRASSAGEGALLFPVEGDRVRAYFIYHRGDGVRRGLSGAKAVPAFIESCTRLGIPADWLENAVAAGPLAEFEGNDKWVKRPYRAGVALIGDAASSNDPAWGNGLALTLRDVRTLADCLLENDNWDEAGRSYAERHDEYFGAIYRVTQWLTELLYEIGPEADARREKAFAAMSEDRSRNPDYIANGPESPSDETARRRMFGEE